VDPSPKLTVELGRAPKSYCFRYLLDGSFSLDQQGDRAERSDNLYLPSEAFARADRNGMAEMGPRNPQRSGNSGWPRFQVALLFVKDQLDRSNRKAYRPASRDCHGVAGNMLPQRVSGDIIKNHTDRPFRLGWDLFRQSTQDAPDVSEDCQNIYGGHPSASCHLTISNKARHEVHCASKVCDGYSPAPSLVQPSRVTGIPLRTGIVWPHSRS
jgi:hypothetical protein